MKKNNCCGCCACCSICPNDAIEMKYDEFGFDVPVINDKKCTNCGLCERTCPLIVKRKENIFQKVAYVALNKNDNERLQSSSGGIFILLAENVIKKDGVVFGAYLDERNNVQHGYAMKKDELKKFMGSKYVQSKIGDNYKKVKKFLLEGRIVLFTGTPCQIEGLKTFLGKEYKNLYTQDIICHGVPSPLVWSKYKQYRKSVDKEEPKQIRFRNKEKSWKKYDITFEYENEQYTADNSKDLFMKAFLKNTSLRESCYNCVFKTENKVSDITLGDYWGIQNIHPEMDDDKGVSAIIINSMKGQILFDEIKQYLIFKETDYENIKKYNSALIKSVKKDPKREKFFRNLNKLPFDELVDKYTYRPPIFRKIINKIKYELSKLKKNR